MFIVIVAEIISPCFAVALNFQSLGLPMDLNDGRFQDNGGCGYVLKPAVLLPSDRSFDPICSRHRLKPTHLLLKVLSQSRIIPSCWLHGLRCNVTGLSVGVFFLSFAFILKLVCVSMAHKLGRCSAELILCLQIKALLPDAVNQQWCKTPRECLLN